MHIEKMLHSVTHGVASCLAIGREHGSAGLSVRHSKCTDQAKKAHRSEDQHLVDMS